MPYAIEYLDERDGPRHVVAAMLFHDRLTALASACALLNAGFSVSKVSGPDFEMGHTALKAYNQSRLGRGSLVL